MQYLDAKIFFDKDQKLNIGVHFKEQFNTKYVNKGSTHTKKCLDAIARGYFIRTAGLTTRTPGNKGEGISEIWPRIHNGLKKAELLRQNQKLPRLGKLLDKREKEMTKTAAERARRRKDTRTIYTSENILVIGGQSHYIR